MFQLNVCGPLGEDKVVDVCEKSQFEKLTIQHLEEKIIKVLEIQYAIRLIFRGEKLEESRLLSSCGIIHMSTIHVVLKLPGGDGCGQDLEDQTNRV